MGESMKKKCLAIGIILLFVGTGIIPAMAQDTEKPLPASREKWLRVGGSGPGNYSKIQDAIDDASNKDTVYVYDDSSPYYENVFVYKSINLIGEDAKNTVINGMGIDDPLWVNTSYVNIRGFTVTNSLISAWSQGICAVDKKWHGPDDPYITLTQINISDCIIKKNGGCGIRLDNTMNVNVWNCTIESNAALSIYNIYSRQVKISQCTITGNGEEEFGYPGGIGICKNPDLGNSENVEVNNCIIQENYFEGVLILSSSNITIYNNIINNNSKFGVLVSSSNGPINDIFIEHNFISSNGQGVDFDAGITLQDPMHNVIIKNNNVSNNNGSGIFGLRSTNLTIVNNGIFKNNQYGLRFTLAFDESIENRLIRNDNKIEGYLHRVPTVHKNTLTNHSEIDAPGWTGNFNNTIFHNNFIKNAQNAIDTGSNTWDNGYPAGGNYWDDYSGYDNYSGPAQNLSGSDGIGDTPYNISGGSNQDRYPFMKLINEPPIADFSWMPQNPITNQQVTFDASASFDPDGTIPLYEWDWNNDGTYEESHATPTATHSWAKPGNYSVTVQTTDDDNATGTITKTVNVIGIISFNIDITGGFGLQAVLLNNGTLNTTKIKWTITLIGGFILLGKTKSGNIVSLTTGESRTIKDTPILGFGKITIQLDVTCAEGTPATQTKTGTVILFFVVGVK
jgi:parallel beta-helix repeat protein